MRIIYLLFLLCSCSVNAPTKIKVEIAGREEETAIYRAEIPPGWDYKPVLSERRDTTRPLAEFHFGAIRLTFHNFPVDSPEQEVPPLAQVARWKRQFKQLDPATASISPQAFSGFVGTLFEGTGMLEGEIKTMMAWAMQLAPEHAQHLQNPASKAEAAHYREMRASFTLKAVGPVELILEQKPALVAFARSFELIEELPSEL